MQRALLPDEPRKTRGGLPPRNQKRRTKGNTAIVEKLTGEKRAFEEDLNHLPPSLGRDWMPFARRIKAARDELRKEYDRAIRAYTNAGQDDQASALTTEQESLRSKSAVNLPYRIASGPDGYQPNVIVPIAPPPPLNVEPAVLIHSEWNFTRRGDGINQGGAFKIIDGVIYHLNAPDPVGDAALDAAGQLHLRFLRHRKIAGGEALVQQAAPGEWRGVLDFLGILWEFQMCRR